MNDLIVNALLSTVNQTEGEKMTINDYLILAELLLSQLLQLLLLNGFKSF